jgi:integrase/recombinase XerC
MSEETEMSQEWERAIGGFLRELETADASPNTIRAYRNDLCELGSWASERGHRPGEIRYRDLRGYARSLSERRLARASVARKLASIRSFGDRDAEPGRAAAEP